MRKLLWFIVRPLFLHRSDRFVTQMEGDKTPTEYERVMLIPAPGPEALVLILIVCVLWYGAILWIAFQILGGSQPKYIAVASGLLALNGTMRTCLRSRERAAEMADWHHTVGRHNRRVLIAAIIGGVAAGAGSGACIDASGSLTQLGIGGWAPILLTGLWEGWNNSRHIGDAKWIRELNLDECRRWYRLSSR
jgi:hypothetical protein